MYLVNIVCYEIETFEAHCIRLIFWCLLFLSLFISSPLSFSLSLLFLFSFSSLSLLFLFSFSSLSLLFLFSFSLSLSLSLFLPLSLSFFLFSLSLLSSLFLSLSLSLSLLSYGCELMLHVCLKKEEVR